MSSKVKVVLNRKNVSSQLLNNAKLMDEVEYQVTGMASIHPTIKVYRNSGTRASVVATTFMSVEQADGVLAKILAAVSV